MASQGAWVRLQYWIFRTKEIVKCVGPFPNDEIVRVQIKDGGQLMFNSVFLTVLGDENEFLEEAHLFLGRLAILEYCHL